MRTTPRGHLPELILLRITRDQPTIVRTELHGGAPGGGQLVYLLTRSSVPDEGVAFLPIAGGDPMAIRTQSHVKQSGPFEFTEFSTILEVQQERPMGISEFDQRS